MISSFLVLKLFYMFSAHRISISSKCSRSKYASDPNAELLFLELNNTTEEEILSRVIIMPPYGLDVLK